jgi:hypothetical protein
MRGLFAFKESLMPAKLDRCIEGLLNKWADNPDDAPKKYKSGEEWKEVKNKDDLRSAAWGICRASTDLCESYGDTMRQIERDLVTAILEEEGEGPLLRGVGAVNRPYIKFMRPLEIVVRDGKEYIRAQLVKYGIYRHPRGPKGKLPFTSEFWQKVQENFSRNIYGQKVFLDKAHEPNKGSLGELEELIDTGDGVDGLFNPTRRGLEAVKERDVNYASIDLEFNYQGNLISVAASEELEEVDLSETVFDALAIARALEESQEEVMSGTQAEETPTTVQADEKLQAMLAEVEAAQAKLQEQQNLIAQEREAFRQERAQTREELRREKVRVFLTSLEQPVDGKCYVKPVIELASAILLNETVQSGDDAVQLAESPSADDLHAYYRGAVEILLSAIPRTVPVKSNVQPRDDRPPSEQKRGEDWQMHFEQAKLAKQEAKDWVALTDSELAELKEITDRRYGIAEEG